MKKLFMAVIILFVAAGFTMEKVERDKILADEAWKAIYDEFQIDSASVEALKTNVGENLKIDVYLAFWCKDSKENVPKFLKIIDSINQDTIEVNYFSVERKATKDTEYFVEDLKIERIPTFVFYREGTEIGRIIEQPEKSMVEDFLEIIS